MESVPFSKEVKAVYSEGKTLAHRSGMMHDTSHILIALFMVPSQAQALLARTGLDPSVLVDGIKGLPADTPEQVDAVYVQAMKLAGRLNAPQVTTVHLLIALTKSTGTRAYKLLQDSAVSVHVLRTEALASLTDPVIARELVRSGMETGEFSSPVQDQQEDDLEEMDMEMETQRPVEKPVLGPYQLDPMEYPLLSMLGRNLMSDAMAGKIDPVVGREKEIARVIDVLNKRRSNNPLLLGEPGVGKTAIVEGLARLVVEGDPVASALKDKLIISININDLIAGTVMSGSLAQRLSDLRTEMAKASRRVIVFFDEIHQILSAGLSDGGMLANDLKGALARGEFTCIGATTFHEYKRTIHGDPALTRRFETINVSEPTLEEADRILSKMAMEYGKFHGVKFDDKALHWAVRLSVRFMPNKSLPDKALNLIDIAGAQARRQGKDLVTTHDIVSTLASLTGLPDNLVSPDPIQRFAGFEQALLKELPAAKEAVFRLSSVIRKNHSARFSNSPLGIFAVHAEVNGELDLLSRTLARELFGSPDNLVRIELAEFSESHSVSTLIGSPPGYVGHEQSGLLSRAANKTPFAVYVWRSVDLADPAVVNLIEHILKEGTILDRQGVRLHYGNTVHLLVLSDSALANRKRTTGFVEQTTNQDDAFKRAFNRVLPPAILSQTEAFIHLPIPDRDTLKNMVIQSLTSLIQDVEASYGLRIQAGPDLADSMVNIMEPGDYPIFLERVRDQVIRDVVVTVAGGDPPKKVTLLVSKNGDLVLRPDKNPDKQIS